MTITSPETDERLPEGTDTRRTSLDMRWRHAAWIAAAAWSAAGTAALLGGPMSLAGALAMLGAVAAGAAWAGRAAAVLHRSEAQARADINNTHVRDMETALAAAQQARDNALQEMRLRTETFAKVSHELRTPLNAILGYAELINQRMAGNRIEDKYVDYASNIVMAGQHMLEVVTRVLDFGQLEAGAFGADFSEVEVGDACSEVLRLCNHQAGERGIALWSEVPPDLPLVRADRRAVRQMLLNLVGNAIKFSQEGGVVTVRAWSDQDDVVRIAVCDTGPGIPEDEITKIRDSFRRASNTRHGTVGHGLGLAITASLVELHGGSLSIANVVDGGAEFVISLPTAKPAAVASKTIAAKAA